MTECLILDVLENLNRRGCCGSGKPAREKEKLATFIELGKIRAKCAKVLEKF